MDGGDGLSQRRWLLGQHGGGGGVCRWRVAADASSACFDGRSGLSGLQRLRRACVRGWQRGVASMGVACVGSSILSDLRRRQRTCVGDVDGMP